MAGMERYDEEDGGLDGSRGWRLGSKLGGLVIGEAPELSRSWVLGCAERIGGKLMRDWSPCPNRGLGASLEAALAALL
jgi:hypothetical protein